MAEGFKKYFNGTTMAGRANVAKATYATLALVYLFYRVRRGKVSPPDATDPMMVEPTPEPTVDPNCNCDEQQPSTEQSVEPELDCSVCRERRPRDNGNCKEDPPPPPPPPPSPSPSPKHRKCPCDDPHRHSETPEQHMPTSSAAEQLDEAHPARELIAQMQEAAGRVLRNVIGAVTGETSSAGDESCSCCRAAPNTADMLEATEQPDDDNCDYESDNQLLSRQRRHAPRSCVPSNTSGDPELAAQTQLTEAEPQGQASPSSSAQAQSAEPNLPSGAQSRFRGFDDDFASEMFFEDYEE